MATVIWEVRDGYIGRQRWHETHIDDDDLAVYENEDERMKFIEECVQEDFNQYISFSIIKIDV